MTVTHDAPGGRSRRFGEFFFIASGVSSLTGIGIFAWQVYVYLRQDRWIPVSFDSIASTFGLDRIPLNAREDLAGIAAFARLFFDGSAAAGFVLVGFLFLLISSSLDRWRRRPRPGRSQP